MIVAYLAREAVLTVDRDSPSRRADRANPAVTNSGASFRAALSTPLPSLCHCNSVPEVSNPRFHRILHALPQVTNPRVGVLCFLTAWMCRVCNRLLLPQLVFTACVDGNVRVWDARTGVCTSLFTGHTDMILDMRLVDPRSGAAAAAGGGGGGEAVPLLVVTASDDSASKVFRWPSPDTEAAAATETAAVTPSP